MAFNERDFMNSGYSSEHVFIVFYEWVKYTSLHMVGRGEDKDDIMSQF